MKYCHTIRTFLNDNYQLPRDWILQQDNATPHTAQIVRRTLEELGVAILPWPSKSPDLNPIEHVWDFLGRRVGAKGVQSLQELTTRLQQEWVSIPQQYLDNLVLSMPRHIGEVIKVTPDIKDVSFISWERVTVLFRTTAHFRAKKKNIIN